MSDLPDDAFQQVADVINVTVARAVANKLPSLLRYHAHSDHHRSELVVAAIAAMVSAAGRLCASFEPAIDGEVLSTAVADQFNEGRADQHAKNHEGSVN